MSMIRVDWLMNGFAQATGRRTALHSLGAAGMALLAALGLGDASAREPGKDDKDQVQTDRRRKKKRKTKRGPAGPAGPTGPAGTVGFTTRVEISTDSPPLGTFATDSASAFAGCGGEGKAVSCGYQVGGAAAELASVFVDSVGLDPARSGCGVSLVRTVEVGSTAGVTIQAIAVCLA